MSRRIASTRLRLLCAAGALFTLGVCGCASARIVRETPEGGVIAVPMNNNCWPMYYRDRAEKLMSAKCPSGYRIDREEFVWNGRPGTEGHRYHDSYFGYTNPDDELAPYLRKEYHISFHAAPPGGKAAPKAAPAKPSQAKSAPPRGEKDELPPPRRLESGRE